MPINLSFQPLSDVSIPFQHQPVGALYLTFRDLWLYSRRFIIPWCVAGGRRESQHRRFPWHSKSRLKIWLLGRIHWKTNIRMAMDPPLRNPNQVWWIFGTISLLPHIPTKAVGWQVTCTAQHWLGMPWFGSVWFWSNFLWTRTRTILKNDLMTQTKLNHYLNQTEPQFWFSCSLVLVWTGSNLSHLWLITLCTPTSDPYRSQLRHTDMTRCQPVADQ